MPTSKSFLLMHLKQMAQMAVAAGYNHVGNRVSSWVSFIIQIKRLLKSFYAIFIETPLVKPPLVKPEPGEYKTNTISKIWQKWMQKSIQIVNNR